MITNIAKMLPATKAVFIFQFFMELYPEGALH
jgi:hypothetical protein